MAVRKSVMLHSQAAAQEAWVRASSDVLPMVLTSEKSRLGGTQSIRVIRSHVLSAQTPGRVESGASGD